MVVVYSTCWTCSLWPTKISYIESQNYVGLVGPLFYSHSVWEIFWEVNYENHWICINNWIYFIFSKLQSRHINKNKCMYCCYENEFRLHSRLPCNIWTFRVQNTTELICKCISGTCQSYTYILAWPYFLRTKLHSSPNGDFCPRIWAS